MSCLDPYLKFLEELTESTSAGEKTPPLWKDEKPEEEPEEGEISD